MATHASTTGAQTRAPSNIVRLPTAAPRKVHQPTPRRCRIAVENGAATQLPTIWASARLRQRMADLETIDTMTRTPATLLAMAMLGIKDREALASVLGQCIAARIRRPECQATRQALAVVRTIYADVQRMSEVR